MSSLALGDCCHRWCSPSILLKNIRVFSDEALGPSCLRGKVTYDNYLYMHIAKSLDKHTHIPIFVFNYRYTFNELYVILYNYI